jgi:hypothetical protein
VSYLRSTIGVSFKKERALVANQGKRLLNLKNGYFWIDLRTGCLIPFNKKDSESKKSYFITTKMAICSVEYQLRVEKHTHLSFNKKLDQLVS